MPWCVTVVDPDGNVHGRLFKSFKNAVAHTLHIEMTLNTACEHSTIAEMRKTWRAYSTFAKRVAVPNDDDKAAVDDYCARWFVVREAWLAVDDPLVDVVTARTTNEMQLED